MKLDSITDLLKSLKEEFLITLPEKITKIESLILSLPEKSDVEYLLRIIHSLKGTAGTHGCHIFTKICHQMEDMMSKLIESRQINTQLAVDILLDYNDLLTAALLIVNNGDENFNVIDLKLNQLSHTEENKNKKILVVEPSVLYESMILSVVESDNVQVTVVNDGFTALENLLMQSYDLLITAMETATLNGDALLAAVRLLQSKNKNIKTILITTKLPDTIENSELFTHIINRSDINNGELKNILVD